MTINDFKNYTKVPLEKVRNNKNDFNLDVQVWIWSEEHQAFWKKETDLTNDCDLATIY